jgi:hypothetical protein
MNGRKHTGDSWALSAGPKPPTYRATGRGRADSTELCPLFPEHAKTERGPSTNHAALSVRRKPRRNRGSLDEAKGGQDWPSGRLGRDGGAKFQ